MSIDALEDVDDCGEEEIQEEDLFYQEEVEDAEGAIGNFFRGLFGRKKDPVDDLTPEEAEEVDEEFLDDEDFEMDDDEDPFIRDGKLYGQDYDKLREKYQKAGKLWRDRRFPPNDSSLFYSSPNPSLEWLRPHQLCEDPRMVVDGIDRFDINQGELGDCWLLAAMSSLAMDKALLRQVFDPCQTFEEDQGYCGIFKFRFWQYGEWVDVLVDDYLPCIDGKLAYIHSDSQSEFWSALLEKAYAKLHGTYEALKGGSSCEAMVDFTGGCSEVWDLTNMVPRDLFNVMLKGYQRRSLNGCSIKPDPDVYEARTSMGLIRGHAYTISKVVKAEIETSRVKGVIPLVRVRNPWGNATEWKGTWADGGREWAFIPDEEKRNLGITFESDGEWWMSYKDFVTYFDQLEMCNLNPESMVESDHSPEEAYWSVTSWEGEWIGGETSGGCRNFLETFIHNPQYMITLEDVDEDDDDDKCTLIVSLMQKGRRALRHDGLELLSIGFVIYRVKDLSLAGKTLGEDFFKYTLSTARSKSFINMREITGRYKLSPGLYVIIPSTYEPGFEGEFLLRTFTERPKK